MKAAEEYRTYARDALASEEERLESAEGKASRLVTICVAVLGGSRLAGRSFYSLWDKVARSDVLAHAHAICRVSDGMPGAERTVSTSEFEPWVGNL